MTKPELATIDGDNWVIDLEPTESMTPRGCFYRISVRWLDNMSPGEDFPQWHLQVPTEGGPFESLVSTVAANDRVYRSPTALDDEVYSGFQLNTTTWDLFGKNVSA